MDHLATLDRVSNRGPVAQVPDLRCSWLSWGVAIITVLESTMWWLPPSAKGEVDHTFLSTSLN